MHGTVENVKPANLSDILDEAVDHPDNEKSPQNIELSGLSESSPGRARTCDKRINSSKRDSTLTRGKSSPNDLTKSWASAGASEFSSTELQQWIDSCPVELEEWHRRAIVCLAKSCHLQRPEDSARSNCEPDRRVIRL